MDRGAWRATVYAVTKGQTRLNDWAVIFKAFLSGTLQQHC